MKSKQSRTPESRHHRTWKEAEKASYVTRRSISIKLEIKEMCIIRMNLHVDLYATTDPSTLSTTLWTYDILVVPLLNIWISTLALTDDFLRRTVYEFCGQRRRRMWRWMWRWHRRGGGEGGRKGRKRRSDDGKLVGDVLIHLCPISLYELLQVCHQRFTLLAILWKNGRDTVLGLDLRPSAK